MDGLQHFICPTKVYFGR